MGRGVDIALRRQQRHVAHLESKVESHEEALAQEETIQVVGSCAVEARGSRGGSEPDVAVRSRRVRLIRGMRDLKQLRLQVRAADQRVEDAVAASNNLGRKVEDLVDLDKVASRMPTSPGRVQAQVQG